MHSRLHRILNSLDYFFKDKLKSRVLHCKADENMVKYRLYYFDSRSRAEALRQLLHLAEVEWEDVRWGTWDRETFHAQYAHMSPYRQAPFLEIIDDNGKSTFLGQSHAIGKYIANKYGFEGETPEEAAQMHMIVDSLENYFVNPIVLIRREKDPVKKAERNKILQDEQIHSFLKNMDRIIKSNNEGDGWLVGNKMSWADVYFAHWLTWYKFPEALDLPLDVPLADYPKLTALIERVYQNPRLAQWIQTRKDSPL